VITSASNPRLRLVRRLGSRSQRKRLGLFSVEGEDLVEAGLAAGLEPLDLLRADVDVAPDLLATVTELPHPPRTVAVFRVADLPRLDSGRRDLSGLALWHVVDPGNVGTLMRAADALGPAFVALSAGCGDPTGHRALRASAGAIFRVPTCPFENAPGRRVGLVAHGGRPLEEVDLGGQVCLVLGAEREGLPGPVLEACEEHATIPLAAGAESLNVAIAGAIALHERRRRS
jgi:TrmH family RNA methyltransferase